MMGKEAIRRSVRGQCGALSSEENLEASSRACQTLFERLQSFSPSRVSLFYSMEHEIQTGSLITALLNEGRHTVLLPRVEGRRVMTFYPYLGDKEKELECSSIGIWEPKPLVEPLVPSIMIMPGIAFDHDGGRVGQGGGFYDTYLENHSQEISRRIAIAFDFQLLAETVPMDRYDQRVDEIVTDKRHLIIK